VPNGSRIKTGRPGKRSFTVVAKSKDGQSVTRTIHYTVLPDSRFTITKLMLHASDGSVTFNLNLPGPGAVDVLETAPKSTEGRFVFARLHLTTHSGGTISAVVNPNLRGSRLVRHHRGTVSIRLSVTYTPTGGRPNTMRGLLLLP
jgi:hypothetical protein